MVYSSSRSWSIRRVQQLCHKYGALLIVVFQLQQCWPTSKKQPGEKLRRYATEILPLILVICNPHYIILLGSSSRSNVISDLSKYFGYNTPQKQPRLPSSTRPPAASRWRHVPPTQQPYDVPANEWVPCPTRRAGRVERHPPGDGSTCSPGWRIVPQKQLRLPSSTWPPAASRWLHARPTQQPYEVGNSIGQEHIFSQLETPVAARDWHLFSFKQREFRLTAPTGHRQHIYTVVRLTPAD